MISNMTAEEFCRTTAIRFGIPDSVSVHEHIERLTNIVAKLPKTADGVPVVPGMTLVWRSGPQGVIGESRAIREFTISDDPDRCTSFANYYSTFNAARDAYEAAEAAKEKTDG